MVAGQVTRSTILYNKSGYKREREQFIGSEHILDLARFMFYWSYLLVEHRTTFVCACVCKQEECLRTVVVVAHLFKSCTLLNDAITTACRPATISVSVPISRPPILSVVA